MRTGSAPFFTLGPYRTFRALQRMSPDPAQGFPRDETFIEFEGSTITIPLTITNVKTKEVLKEILRLKAFMRLEVYPAYMNQQGTREFQFIIRDWELYEQSRLLNMMFMGDHDGLVKKEAPQRRHTVGITFSASKRYAKYHDNENLNLGPVEEIRKGDGKTTPQYVNDVAPVLSIEHMCNQWNNHNDLVWEIVAGGGKDAFGVRFYRARFEKGRTYSQHDLVAEASGIAAGGAFSAKGPPDPDVPPNPRRPEPLIINWRLGSAPVVGTTGIVHQIAPPQSFCVADQGPLPGQPEDSADFPARVTYAASYDVWINNLQILADQAGVAMARNVTAIPPRDVLVAFEKPFSGNFVHPTSGDPIRIEFGSGTCTGMVEISQAQWQHGRTMAFAAQKAALFAR